MEKMVTKKGEESSESEADVHYHDLYLQSRQETEKTWQLVKEQEASLAKERQINQDLVNLMGLDKPGKWATDGQEGTQREFAHVWPLRYQLIQENNQLHELLDAAHATNTMLVETLRLKQLDLDRTKERKEEVTQELRRATAGQDKDWKMEMEYEAFLRQARYSQLLQSKNKVQSLEKAVQLSQARVEQFLKLAHSLRAKLHEAGGKLEANQERLLKEGAKAAPKRPRGRGSAPAKLGTKSTSQQAPRKAPARVGRLYACICSDQ